jgi:uncharacterized protein (DUF2126 family)/transglutaminase-like putative cysteine protease
VSFRHLTTYDYDRPVTLFPQLIRLRPAAHNRTKIISYSLKVRPKEHFLNWQQDPFGNFTARVVFPKEERRFEVEVGLVAELAVINPFDFFLEPSAENFPFAYAPALKESLAPYLEIKEDGPRLRAWVKAVDRARKQTTAFLVELNQRVQQDIRYGIRMESGVQTCEETLGKASGSCRDSAWLLVQALRHLGIAARFASGYLIQLRPDSKPLEGPEGPATDFTDLHAWAEAFVPGAGWIGLDSTSGLLAGEGHIPLSCSPSPEDAAPISGATSKAEVIFHHEMSVRRIEEAPRVTAPFAESEWERLLALGDQVDADMEAAGLRLTQGGEPTFVSIDDMDGPEWNTEALGARKAALAQDLLWRLKGRFSPGALLHFGQGKWYPGEPLPRWAYTAYWRADGLPLWRQDVLQARAGGTRYGLGDAQGLARAIARQLALDSARVKPGYEDAFYYLWKEGNLPLDFDPHRKDWRSEADRARTLKLLERGLDKATGYVLPLAADFDGRMTHWRTGSWDFRRGHLFLLPGDSPMGFRLPMSSLAYGPGSGPEIVEEFSPLAEREPLARSYATPYRRQYPGPRGAPSKDIRPAEGPGAGRSPGAGQSPAWIPVGNPSATPSHAMALVAGEPVVRTALCVEARDGILHVFLPPVPRLESFLELIEAVEEAAAETGMPVRIEGYAPPSDHRLLKFSITPDPGVIEVNIHPSASWRELVEKTEVLYEEARQCRLGAEKFQLDGRHTGTGGGNHVVLGAERPADSPFLRRPHLLRSMLNFWQNHPSLSYLFSGLFIGPTSQSPRSDEGRDSVLDELQLAFKQVPQGAEPPPWLVDRLFRNLLVDMTGNTHRAEFCIDKLYSPDSLSGRLGLLELRGFEMPPHPRLAAAQSLLVRALAARFWDRPYAAPLQPWGTSLHDRWMLPHHLWRDFEEVAAFLGESGYPLEAAWYRPFLEFRFPLCGEVVLGDISLELRQAAEPWHVLGEEAGGQGTSRYVDSSLERLQVKVKGIADRRHAVAVNGVALPLMPTGVRGEAVAGLRFRAWQPPSALQPLIPVHSPLAIDVVDTWNGVSLGGCTHHVAHPAGRNYATFPVNAAEAEARRAARFEARGHTPGPFRLVRPPIHPDHPHTLDLRWH